MFQSYCSRVAYPVKIRKNQRTLHTFTPSGAGEKEESKETSICPFRGRVSKVSLPMCSCLIMEGGFYLAEFKAYCRRDGIC